MSNLKKTVKKAAAAVLTVLLLIPAVSGCAPAAQNAGGTKEEENWAEELNVLQPEGGPDTLNLSGFDEKLLDFLSERAEGNFMVSPLSFRYALGLLIAGAEKETKEELLSALGVEKAQEWIDECLRFNGFVRGFDLYLENAVKEHEEYQKQGLLPADAEKPYMALRVANSVWKNEALGVPFTDAYKESVSKNFGAEYRNFTSENAVERINEWASIKTEKLIPELLPASYDTSNLAVVLMNALYFKDSWINTFSKSQTAPGEFHTSSGENVTKDFMHQTDSFYYYADDETELAVLPMKAGIYMAFVLGDRNGVAEKINAARYRKVDLSIPKIDLSTSFDQGELKEFLRSNGVSRAFDREKAEFSGMIDADVFVSDILQKTKIKLDEDGVEAAAVTVIPMCGNAYDPDGPVPFTADRPFTFYVYANTGESMAVLFAGEIVE